MLNKRAFMLGGCAGLLAGGAAAAATTAATATLGLRERLPELPGRGYSPARWRRYLGQDFALDGPGAGSVRLESMEDVSGAGAPGARQFSLRFSATAPALPAATRWLRHAASGQRLALYLQPSGPDTQGQAGYVACFSLLA